MDVATVDSQATHVVAVEKGEAKNSRSYHVACLHSENEVGSLADSWAALMAQASHPSIFQTWEWATTWWGFRDPGEEMWILAATDDEGKLAGLLPLMLVHERRGPIRLRRLTFLGRGINYPVHLDAIVRTGEERPVCREMLAYLEAHAREWDVLDLGDMAAGSALSACLSDSGNGRVGSGWPRRRLSGAPARVSALPDTWEFYQKECLSSTRRKHLGQYRRKLEREQAGLVRFYSVANAAELRWALDAMGELNKSRWHDRRITSAFDHQGFVDFHRALAQVALDRGWLRFYVLRVGDEMAASVYGFLFGDVFYCYQLTFNANWGKYGPGNLILGYAIENAIADGAREWNMMRGDQEYKLSWTDEERFDSHEVLAASLAGRFWLLGDTLYDTARRLGKTYLPRTVRDRITQLVSARELQQNEPAKPKDLSD